MITLANSSTMTNYPTSTDYDFLIRLMEEGHRLVCFCDYDFRDGTDPLRDVCRTMYEPPTPDHPPFFAASSRGICYAGGFRIPAERFKADCAAVHLEFIPPLTPAPDPEVSAAQFQPCLLPPTGWTCTRPAGHKGPCAAHSAPDSIPNPSDIPTPISDDAARKGCYLNDPKNYASTAGKQMVHIDVARDLERRLYSATDLRQFAALALYEHGHITESQASKLTGAPDIVTFRLFRAKAFQTMCRLFTLPETQDPLPLP